MDVSELEFLRSTRVAQPAALYPSRELRIPVPAAADVDALLRTSLAALDEAPVSLRNYGYGDVLRTIGADRSRLTSLVERAADDESLLRRGQLGEGYAVLVLAALDEHDELLVEISYDRKAAGIESPADVAVHLLLRGCVEVAFDVSARLRPDYDGFRSREMEGSSWSVAAPATSRATFAADTVRLTLLRGGLPQRAGITAGDAGRVIHRLRHLAIV